MGSSTPIAPGDPNTYNLYWRVYAKLKRWGYKFSDDVLYNMITGNTCLDNNEIELFKKLDGPNGYVVYKALLAKQK